jgi:hypothetical protein
MIEGKKSEKAAIFDMYRYFQSSKYRKEGQDFVVEPE